MAEFASKHNPREIDKMSSRAKKKAEKKSTLSMVPPIDQEAKKAMADAENQKAANARLVWRKLQRLDTCAINLREVTRFDPPDPAGPPNKHVVLDADGTDFAMVAVIRSRALKFLDALDRYEDVVRWVIEHPTETIAEADIPQLHLTMSKTPEEIAAAPKKPEAEE